MEKLKGGYNQLPIQLWKVWTHVSPKSIQSEGAVHIYNMIILAFS
jgi:hypothetical protein